MNNPIAVPGSNAGTYDLVITLKGDGRGVSIIRAGTAMTAVLLKDTNWNRGDTFTDLTFDANAVAQHAVLWQRGGEAKIHAYRRVERNHR